MRLATIIHVSDLHFGSTFRALTRWRRALDSIPARHPHSPEVAVDLAQAVKSLAARRHAQKIPVAIVHTGDLTQSGKERQFDLCHRYLRSEIVDRTGENVGFKVKCFCEPFTPGEAPWSARLFEIPGNHDYWKHPRKWFRRVFRNSFPRDFPSEYTLSLGGRRVVSLFGLDSNRAPNRGSVLSKGFVEPAQLGHLAAKLSAPNPDRELRVVCVHHPLESNGNFNDERIRLSNRDLVSATLFKAGAHLVIGGHIHEYRKFGGGPGSPLNLIAGSGTQQNADHNFLVFDVFVDRVEWSTYAYDPTERVSGFVRIAQDHAPR